MGWKSCTQVHKESLNVMLIDSERCLRVAEDSFLCRYPGSPSSVAVLPFSGCVA